MLKCIIFGDGGVFQNKSVWFSGDRRHRFIF